MPHAAAPEACPFQDSLEMLGKRHALTLLWVFQQRSPRRFNEIKAAARVNAVTLTERLAEFEGAGVVTRQVFNETPPRVDYDLTRKGRELLVILDDLESWSRKHRAR